MLTENEKECFKSFLLKEFQIHDLLSLVETVTNRMVSVRSKQEAIKAIISHSDNAIELLRRKKVKRENIFRFLASENLAVSGTSDKATLIWQFLLHCGTKVPDFPTFEKAEEVAKESPSSTQQLAEQFTSWFYRQLNSSAPGNIPTPSEWGPQHFWGDSRLALFIISSERRKEVFDGAELVANRLKSFVSDEGLIFNPNIGPSGTRGLDEPHGLVIVMVCGTVHQNNMCLGLFEQQFGLIRDPLNQNTWKIKFTEMNLKQCSVERMPTLEGSHDRLLAIT